MENKYSESVTVPRCLFILINMDSKNNLFKCSGFKKAPYIF
jgi:hypothetical protein